MEYIHYNPVAAGLCAYPEEYKYSSAKFYETGVDECSLLSIGWLSAVVGEAWLQKPPHKTPTTG